MAKVAVTKQPGLEYRDSNHSYWLDGKRILGVTTICGVLEKPALVPWVGKMAAEFLLGTRDPFHPDQWLNPPAWEAGQAYTTEQIAELATTAGRWHADTKRKAADFGTAAHDWIEAYIYGEKRPEPEAPEVKASCAAFVEWIARHHVEFVEVEWSVTDGKVGGKLDALALVDGVLRVLDHKTGKGIYMESVIQVGKYHRMASVLTSVPLVARPIILHEPKDGSGFAAYELPVSPELCGEMFEHLYAAYEIKKEMEKATKAMQPMNQPEEA
jgi:hypothetical protein